MIMTRKGFTLIEAMIIFAIIAIIAAIAIPAIYNIEMKARYKNITLGKEVSPEATNMLKEFLAKKENADVLKDCREMYGPLPWEIFPQPVAGADVQELNQKIESLQDKVKQLQSKVAPFTYEVKFVQGKDGWTYAVIRSDGVTISSDKDPAVCRNLVKYLEEAYRNGYNQPKE